MPEENAPQEVDMFAGAGALSYDESPLKYFTTAGGNPGIYIEWERITPMGVVSYNILRSTHFDGNYQQIDTVDWPQNQYVDSDGHPSYYYKVEEVNASSVVITTSQPILGEELLVKATLLYDLADLLNVPVYDEEVIFNQNRTRGAVVFPFWNFKPRPQIRISGYADSGNHDSMIILSENTPIYKTTNGNTNNYPDGLKVRPDYMGNIYFVNANDQPVSIQPYDMVVVDYNVRLFSGAQMNSALYRALQAINSQPGASTYHTVGAAPYWYDAALVSRAMYYLIRALLVGLNQRQKRILLQDPDNNAYDVVSKLSDVAKMYKEEFDDHLKKLPIKKYPKIGSVVIPELALPGGRTRLFRQIWKGGNMGA